MTLDDQQRAHRELLNANRLVREYATSDGSRAVVALMDALIAVYCLELMGVSAEGLAHVQAALKQVMAIRRALTNEGVDPPKI